MISKLPELGTLDRQQIARLVGVAPTNRDSGSLRGKRTTGGGRAAIRTALFMPTILAKQYNPTIKAFYDRLGENGKPKMVALIASMRKLLTIRGRHDPRRTNMEPTTQNNLTSKTVATSLRWSIHVDRPTP